MMYAQAPYDPFDFDEAGGVPVDQAWPHVPSCRPALGLSKGTPPSGAGTSSIPTSTRRQTVPPAAEAPTRSHQHGRRAVANQLSKLHKNAKRRFNKSPKNAQISPKTIKGAQRPRDHQ